MIADDFFTEFQSTYNTSWYLGFSQRGSALRGNHWKTDAVNQKANKCRKFIKKDLRPERKTKETVEVRIKGSGKGRLKAPVEGKIKGSANEKTIGNDHRKIKGTAERKIKDTAGLAQYKT